jgi:hypothetical protein
MKEENKTSILGIFMIIIIVFTVTKNTEDKIDNSNGYVDYNRLSSTE